MKKLNSKNNLVSSCIYQLVLVSLFTIKNSNMEVRVKGKAVCTKCNSVTLYFDNGAINSMARSTYNKLPKQYHTDKQFNVWCCDRCVNHYGIDINTTIYGKQAKQLLGQIQTTSCMGNDFKNEISIESLNTLFV